jgi:asparagine synthase (glutamine-hydrolysing)
MSGRPVDPSVVDRMGATMRHRGPDDMGAYSDESLIMGMTRLAIIDVAGGQQPIQNEDGNVVVVCNGEIYNYRSLRDRLRASGHKFRTASDTEVIVHLYEEHGARCVEHLSGMFAFAIWDKKAKRLVVARDRLGIKPLYLTVESNRLAFASELKSLLDIPGVRRELNKSAVSEFLTLGYVPAPLTILEGVEKLDAGSMLIADKEGTRVQRYWQLESRPETGIGDTEWAAEIRAEIERSVVSQMVSDVPLGAFLSGGIDSSAVVAFMAKHSDKPVKTYSIGFDNDTGGNYYNELDYARQISERFGTEHREIVVKPDIARLMPDLCWHLDEPIADSAFITTYLVSRFAREDVTVILSGVGGDELFGGYRRYWSEYLAQLYRKIPAGLRRSVLQPLAGMLPTDRNSQMLDYFRLAKGFLSGAELPADARYEEYIRVFDSATLADLLGTQQATASPALAAAFSAATDDDPVSRLIEVDLKTQLPDDLLMLTDRMSMAASLECRVPLLDDGLVNLAQRMPSSMKVRGTQLKYGLKMALRGVLPDEIIDRKKRGFGAPVGGWFKRELSQYLDSVLSESRVRERNIFDWDKLRAMCDLHRANREDYSDHLLAMISLEIWCQLYLDGVEPGELTDRLVAPAAA